MCSTNIFLHAYFKGLNLNEGELARPVEDKDSNDTSFTF
jgi:hypothetical protein